MCFSVWADLSKKCACAYVSDAKIELFGIKLRQGVKSAGQGFPHLIFDNKSTWFTGIRFTLYLSTIRFMIGSFFIFLRILLV